MSRPVSIVTSACGCGCDANEANRTERMAIYLQHIRPHSLHDLNPTPRPLKSLLPLLIAVDTALEVREWLQHHDNQSTLLTQILGFDPALHKFS
jgi:hypothetical protein